MSVTVLRLAALLYAAGAASYILFFARPVHARAVRVGDRVFIAGTAPIQ